MDYYQSTRPEVDDSGLSGGVSFKLGAQIAVANIPNPPFFSYQRQSSRSSQRYTLTICVNGVPKLLDISSLGGPYNP
jgi:hypothetical protein